MDTNRLQQFMVTKKVYDLMPQKKEFIIPTRSATEVRKFLKANGLMKNVRLFSYQVEQGFNPSKAFNIGVRAAKYDRTIITSPEVCPQTNVLAQLEELPDQNVICQVADENEAKQIDSVLVSTSFRADTPAYYFLGCFNKADIEKINGWDEEFMKGYAYEDNDFGARWVRAGLSFVIRDDIRAVHQYHPRGETIPGGSITNYDHFNANTANNVIRCTNGLEKIGIE